MTGTIWADRGYIVSVVCPNCGGSEIVRMGVAARLDLTRGSSQLGVKVKADKVDHACGQATIDDVVGGADA